MAPTTTRSNKARPHRMLHRRVRKYHYQVVRWVGDGPQPRRPLATLTTSTSHNSSTSPSPHLASSHPSHTQTHTASGHSTFSLPSPWRWPKPFDEFGQHHARRILSLASPALLMQGARTADLTTPSPPSPQSMPVARQGRRRSGICR